MYKYLKNSIQFTTKSFRDENMADMQLKFITNARYRSRQVRLGYSFACYFRVNIEFGQNRQHCVRLIDITSLQECANYMTKFYEPSGKYNATQAADSPLLSDEDVEKRITDYMSCYPAGENLPRLYSKLKGNALRRLRTGILNTKIQGS